MKKYNLMGINYVVDGDDIYKQIGTSEEVAESFKKEVKQPKKREVKIPTVDIETGEERKGRLEPDDVKQLKDMINAEYPPVEIARKFQVSIQYIYVIKSTMKKNGELRTNV